jgi:hypothetical protein
MTGGGFFHGSIILSRKLMTVLAATMLLALLLAPATVSAHETIQVNGYDVEYGWLNEPVIVGQANAIVLNISKPDAAAADVDVSNLKIEVTYGGETKALTLQPLGEDTPGQFIAPLTPTRAGQFTVRLSGKIDQTDITPVEVQPEEVQTADIVAFPKAAEESDSEGLGLAGWLGIGGIVLGLAGVILGGLALARRK